MKINKYLYLLTICTMIFVGCEGGEGPVGPQGEQGVAGVDGTDGKDGSANVMAYTSEWTIDNILCLDGAACTVAGVLFDVDDLTTELVDNAAIMAYFRTSETQAWLALPMNYSTYNLTYAYSEELFQILFVSSDGSQISDEKTGGFVKFVIIPPTASAKMVGEDFANRVKEPGLISYENIQPLPTTRVSGK